MVHSEAKSIYGELRSMNDEYSGSWNKCLLIDLSCLYVCIQISEPKREAQITQTRSLSNKSTISKKLSKLLQLTTTLCQIKIFVENWRIRKNNMWIRKRGEYERIIKILLFKKYNSVHSFQLESKIKSVKS